MPSKDKRVLLLQPLVSECEAAHILVRQAAAAAGVIIFRIDDVATAGTLTESIYSSIEECDLIICDVTHSNPSVMYELGYAHALQKPVIHITQRPEYMPFDLRSVRTLLYDFDLVQANEFTYQLQRTILEALDNPIPFSVRPRTETEVNSLFVSYSHNDRGYLDRLLVHLRPLEKEGLVDVWEDSRIEAGDKCHSP